MDSWASAAGTPRGWPRRIFAIRCKVERIVRVFRPRLSDPAVFATPDPAPPTNVPVLFGDWSRFLIRHVPTEAAVIRYDELFMVNMQKGYEMLFRADAKIMHTGGSGDDPIKALKCHV